MSPPEPAAAWVPPDLEPTRLLLVRHGSTEHSLSRRFSGRNELPLIDHGVAQASAAAVRVLRWQPISAVICSPLRRARQSAELVAAAAGVDAVVDDDLAETDFGDFEGLTYAEAAQRRPHELAEWQSAPDRPPPHGESFAAVTARVDAARERIVAAHRGTTVAVVTHVTPIKVLLRLALGAPPSALFAMFLDTSSISIVDYYADGPGVVRLVNDTSHLDGLRA